jgi:release factor glutamine methyltransferase
MATIASLLAASELPPLEAQVLAGHALALGRASLLADQARTLTDEEARRVERLFLRRRAGEPVAYLTGEREFFGLSLAITPDVLIPRPETELLVALALELAPACARVLDLGTGSGAIAVAIAHEEPDMEVIAVDACADALAVARENARRHGATIRFVYGDWYAGLATQTPGERFDVIVANPPYVAAGDEHLEQGDLRFEPRAALVGGADGLDAIRGIVARAREHLRPDGWLLFEHGYDQGERCRSLLAMYGYARVQTWPDLAGLERVSGARAR